MNPILSTAAKLTGKQMRIAGQVFDVCALVAAGHSANPHTLGIFLKPAKQEAAPAPKPPARTAVKRLEIASRLILGGTYDGFRLAATSQKPDTAVFTAFVSRAGYGNGSGEGRNIPEAIMAALLEFP